MKRPGRHPSKSRPGNSLNTSESWDASTEFYSPKRLRPRNLRSVAKFSPLELEPSVSLSRTSQMDFPSFSMSRTSEANVEVLSSVDRPLRHSRRLVHFKHTSPKGSSDADHSAPDRGPHPASTDSDSDHPRLRRLRPRVPVPRFNPNAELRSDRSIRSQIDHETVRRKRGRPRKFPRIDDRSVVSDSEASKGPHNVRADEHSDDAGVSGGQDNGDTRRYPVRNRRHTAMYQVEYSQSTHGPARNWLAGTGYEHSGRGRRHRTSSRYYRGLQHSGSSTSSSMDSDSGTSTPEREHATFRIPSSHTSWRHAVTGRTNNAADLDEDEARFERRRTKSIMHARSELLPINMRSADPAAKSTLSDRLLSGTTLADIEPMAVDASVGFDQVGGHDRHILALKESIVLPLMYPDIFSGFGIDPPRGVLFCGPPGTGKTMLARALANECSRMSSTSAEDGKQVLRRPIAFFMRKGADCLSKWVGESERQLRLLFDQAYRMRPSIIFFDEIDGLAPVRSSKQDQIHSSIVSTLLSLMDGLDSRAEVVIIGATNRPDAIDPALRRPGRFDREFTFSLPCESVRKRILEVHTAKWNPKPDSELLSQLANITSNFSGADLKALVTEACLCCLRRQYPQVYESRVKLALDQKYLTVQRADWLRALRLVRPSNDRADLDVSAANQTPVSSALAATKRCPLSLTLSNLFTETLVNLTQLLAYALLRPGHKSAKLPEWNSTMANFQISGSFSNPRLLLTGDVPSCLMDAVWHRLESVQVFTISSTNLVAFPTSIGMCPEAAIAQILSAVKRAANNNAAQSHAEDELVQGVVLYIPHIDLLLRRLPRSAALCLVDRIEALIHELLAEDFALPLPEHMSASCEFLHAASTRWRRVFIVATLADPRRGKAPVATKLPANKTPETIPKVYNSPADLTSPTRRIHSSVTQPVDVDKLCNGVGLVRKSPGRRTPKRINPRVEKFTQPTDRSPTFTVRQRDHPTISDNSSSFSSASPSDVDSPTDTAYIPTLNKNVNGNPSHRNNVLQTSNTGADQSPLDLVQKRRSRYYCRLLTQLFHQFKSVHVVVPRPCKTARTAFFTPVLTEWPRRALRESSSLYESDANTARGNRPPSPLPVAEEPDNAPDKRPTPALKPEELLEIEREEAQLFRRLRQVLRRVVAHLARHRRFAVFSRPVQIDEAPDYYEVIKDPMDLGSIRDRIDARKYVNVEDFMKDIELIYHNALEYNPANVPRSRDIRARAAEFWDEACLKMEEELYPPDLDERCRAATEAQALRAAATKQGTTESHQRTSRTSMASSTPGKSVGSTNTPASLPKPLPMPQGGRFSRRLHGQPPVLEPQEVQLLQSTKRRRDSSLTLPSPESKVLREKLGINESDSEKHSGSEMRSPSPRVSKEHSKPPRTQSPTTGTPKVAGESSQLVDLPLERSPTPGPVASSSPHLTRSPDLSSAHLTLNKPDFGADPGALNKFLQTVVNGTHGWSATELIKLHREFSYLILWSSHRTGLLPELERVFESYCQRNVSDLES